MPAETTRDNNPARARTKLDWLREQAAAYLRDAEAQTDHALALRLTLLAVRCQETILELQHGIKLDARES